MAAIAAYVRQLRDTQGISREKLAEMVGTSGNNIWRIEEQGQEPRGGVFRLRVDAGSWFTVDTDAPESYHTAGIGGLTPGVHTLRVELLSAPVTLFGVDVQIAGPGVRLHKLGNGGASAEQFRDMSMSGLRALRPDVVMVLLGTNDQAYRTPEQYAEDMATLVQAIRAVTPADIVLVAPGENGMARALPMTAYAAALHGVAVRERATYADGDAWMGPYESAAAQGWYGNTAHLSTSGGLILAGLLETVMAP